MNALIYLRMQTPVMTGEDLARLAVLRQYAVDTGYDIVEAWPVYDPYNAPGGPREWYDAKQDLSEGRFDVIVLWHEDFGVPDTYTQDDLHTLKTLHPPKAP
jgi:hypothetical protein